MKGQKIKALWLPSWYPHPEHPFLGSFTRRDAEAVAGFCDIVVLFAVESTGHDYEILIENRPQGFKEVVVYYSKTKPGQRWLKLFRYISACSKGMKKIKKDGFLPDILHIHVIWPAAIVGLFFNWRFRLPFLATEHWSGYHKGKKNFQGIQKWTARFFAPRAGAILTVSEGQASAMRRLGIRGRYITSPNMVDTRQLPIRSPTNDGICRFIHVSSFHDEQKNISGIIRAIKNLGNTRQDFLLTMVGGLDLVPYFQKMVDELGISHLVEFTGMLPLNEVFRALSQSDAFVMFSNHEGLPCAMLEAMAIGLPVISTDIEGLEKWVTPDKGFLVPIGDEFALELAMNKMIEIHTTFDSLAIREWLASKCSYEVAGNQVFQVYEQILNTDS